MRMNEQHGNPINQLLHVMARLRDPNGGCPWDLQQNFDTIAPYTVEEAHEVAEAIARDDRSELKDELGDLLLQVVFHARMAEEEGSFDFHDVAQAIHDKMVRRHPHVFGDARSETAEEVKQDWESIKAAERAEKGEHRASHLDGVPDGLPPLQRAARIQKKASKVGFDWTHPDEVVEQVHSELDELKDALAGLDQQHIDEEFGDVLFTLVNLSRHVRVDAGQSLRRASEKFARRFRAMEARAEAAGQDFASLDRDELEELWQQAKRR
jgi:ATP diphosphatase